MKKQMQQLIFALAIIVAASPATTAQTLGTLAGGFTGDGGLATATSLRGVAGVAVDNSGYLYVAEEQSAAIRRVDIRTGIITTVVGIGYSGDSPSGVPVLSGAIRSPMGLALDPQGNLYFSEFQAGRVRRVDGRTGVMTIILSDGRTSDNISIDQVGNVYVPERDWNRVRRIDSASGTVSTVAGTGESGYAGDGGPALSAKLAGPRAVVVDHAGDLLIADANNNCIRRLRLTNGEISTYAGQCGTDPAGRLGDFGLAIDAGIRQPSALAVDPGGNVYVAEAWDNRVRRIEASTGVIRTVWQGSGPGGPMGITATTDRVYIGAPERGCVYAVEIASGAATIVAGGGTDGDGRPAHQASFIMPAGVAVDAQRNVFVADFQTHRVRRIDARTGIISTYAGKGSGSNSGDNGPATEAGLPWPSDVAVGPTGDLYVSSQQNTVRKVDHTTGVITTIAGITAPDWSGAGYSGDGGPATAAALKQPSGIAFDGNGALYVADTYNYRVRRIDEKTGVITTVAGNGSETTSGDGGAATAAGLHLPMCVAANSAGDLFIGEGVPSDLGWVGRVRRVEQATGVITTVATINGGAADLFVDGNGTLWITERNRVSTWDPATRRLTVRAGTTQEGSSPDGVPPLLASFSSLGGLWVDNSGSVYFSDTGARKIRILASNNVAPELAPVRDRTVGEGVSIRIVLSATDADGDNIRFSLREPLAGASLSDSVFAWTPDFGQAGAYRVTFVASDGRGGIATQTATITVPDVNRAPVLVVADSLVGAEGLPMSLRLQATDADSDSVALTAQGLPPGASLTGGVFEWTPGYSQAGIYQVQMVADDGRGGRAEKTVRIRVAERNGPPRLAPIAPLSVRELEAVRLRLSAQDPDGEALSLAVADAPLGAVLRDSVFLWTPALYDRGQYRVRFSVADTRGGIDTTTAVITVAARSRYTVLSTDTLRFGAVAVGQSKTLQLTVSNAGTEVLAVSNLVPGDPQYSVSTGSFSLLPSGARDISVTFVPVEGRSASSTLTLLSNDPDRPALTVALSATSGVVGGPAAISVLPTSLSFGSVALGQSKGLSLLVTNDGGSNLRVLNIVSSSGDVTVSKSSFTLAAGAEEMLTVTLQPTMAGSFSETLDIPSNDPLHPVLQVPLRATVGSSGGRPSVALDAASLSFGQVAIGETSEFLLPVRNAGTATLTISNVVSDNVQVVVSPTTLSVPPQETRSLTVRYRPMPGMPMSGRLTLYSNDTAQPQVGVAWSAVEVRSPYLSLTRVTPADAAFGVATSTEIQLVFSEPLYYRRGFTALDVAVTPEPLSGPVDEDVQVRGDGRTVVIPVTLARNTVYRLVVHGATGRSGLELYDMVESSFSTGAAPPVLAKVSGRVTETSGLAVSGSVYLMDASHRLSSQASIAMDGSFELTGVAEGSYGLYLDGTVADGRTATGSYDSNGDGTADALVVRAGVDQTGLSITVTVRSGTAPVVSSSPVTVDLDSSAGNQGFASLGSVGGGRSVVLEVYATAADGWTGSAVTVAFDSTRVSFSGAEAGDNLLQKSGGTALFLSHVDPAASAVEFGGAILGPTSATAVSGAGLLGRFRFTTADGFSGETALRVTRVKVQSLSGRTNVEPNIQALLRSSGDGGGTPAAAGPLRLDFNLADGDQGQTTGGSASVGKTYQVQLFASGAPTINGWSAKMEYDPLQVRYVSGSFQPSNMVPGLLSLVEEKSSYVSIGGAVLGGSGTGSGNGLLGTASFEVLPGFTGETELVIRQMSWKVAGSGEQMLTVDVRGTITAAAAGLAGDFNGDGAVNFSDFFLFADAFGGTDPAYDLNGDGAVNFSDFFVFADAFGGEARAKLMELAQQYLGLPAQAGIESAYPNPFNASTTIRYRLAAMGVVKLSVHGLTGQRVASLLNEWQEQGTHEVTWNGVSEDGRSVATGVYLVRLETSTGIQVRRVTLLR